MWIPPLICSYAGNPISTRSLMPTWRNLQKGFTTGSSSLDVALIRSECTSEVKNMRKPWCSVHMMHRRHSFDVVDHCNLLRKLYSDGITGDDWFLLNDMYVDLASVIQPIQHPPRCTTYYFGWISCPSDTLPLRDAVYAILWPGFCREEQIWYPSNQNFSTDISVWS